MKLAIKGTSLFAALMLVCAGAAFSVDQEPVLGFAGSVEAGPVSVSKAQQQPQPRIDATSVVYDNTASPALFAVSSTDLASVWGDRVNTVGVGVLNEHVFSVFNSGSSSGPLLTAVIRIDFFDGVTALPIGAYTTNVNFGAGLQPGFYSLVTVSNLDPLVIILAVQDVIVTQTIQSFTGGNRFGIVSLDPPTVGSSAASMYISSATIGAGVPGFYTFGNGPANPAHKITLTLETVAVEEETWSGVKNLFR